ncbi:olfactory receptor 52A1-like [Ornithorhynchus anatinus]|uniref:olfactory receptor 52A1-like n=1 Tax=Ornithorhynchus anatinus TaxID=9258 RepID=UPI00015565C9|nr:olfactory receptor 52A1-like [Ornithorhynchus anatinus]
MATPNGTYNNPLSFILLGIPGLESLQHWIGIPFCGMFTVAVLGNCTVLIVIKRNPELHQPMYLLLAMLALNDLGICPTIVPKTLGIFWFNLREIQFNSCLAQMFFVHVLAAFETGILVAMALDRYVAICHPLRYSSILTPNVLLGMGLLVVLRGVFMILPFLLLIKARVNSFRSTVVPHTYCEHMAVLKLATDDTRVNRIYGLAVVFIIFWFDSSFITTSYTLIFKAVFRLPGKEARLKAFNTCTAHIIIIMLTYTLALFSFLGHRYGHHLTPYVHILLANFYLLVPTVVNPIIYGAKTKEIRVRVITMFSLRGTLSKM